MGNPESIPRHNPLRLALLGRVADCPQHLRQPRLQVEHRLPVSKVEFDLFRSWPGHHALAGGAKHTLDIVEHLGELGRLGGPQPVWQRRWLRWEQGRTHAAGVRDDIGTAGNPLNPLADLPGLVFIH